MSSSDITVLKQAKTVFSLRSMRTGESFAVTGEMMVGRELDCDIRLNSPLVSRYHAKITPVSDALLLEDLNSSNGTYVNGDKISTKTAVKAGDKVSFDSISFRITSPNSSKTSSPPPISPSAPIGNGIPDEQTRSRTIDELAAMDDKALLDEGMHSVDEFSTVGDNGEPDIDSLVKIVKQNLASELAEQEADVDNDPAEEQDSDPFADSKPVPQANEDSQTTEQKTDDSSPSLKEAAQERDEAFELALEPMEGQNEPDQSEPEPEEPTPEPAPAFDRVEKKENKTEPARETAIQRQQSASSNQIKNTAISQPDFVDPKTKVRVRLKDGPGTKKSTAADKQAPKPKPAKEPTSTARFDSEGPTRQIPTDRADALLKPENKAFEEQYPFAQQDDTDELITGDDYHDRVANLKFDWQAAGEKVPEESIEQASNEFLNKLHHSLSEQDESLDDNDIWLTHSNESEDSRSQFLNATRTQSPQLVMMSAPARGKIFSLDDEKTDWTIGRAAESDIYIPDVEIAFQHSNIELTSEGFVIKTCQMTNGMLINNKFTNRAVLKNGDVMQFGNVELVFQCPDEDDDELPEELVPVEQAVMNKTFDYGAYVGAVVILAAILLSILTTGS